MKFDTEVLIAGGGPVGSVAAYILAQAGIDVILFEAHPTGVQDLRASTIHPPTLEMLDEIGVAQTLIEQGLKAPVYQYRNRATGAVIAFDMSELADMTRFPFRLQCEQFKLAHAMSVKLAETPHGRVMFGSRLTSFEQDEMGVTAHVETPTAMERYRAKYLIGCDGANSIVRKWLGIEFDGFTYPEKFLTLSTQFPIESVITDLAHVNYIADPDEWVVLLRVSDFWRVLVPASEEETDEYLLSDEKKDIIFQNLVGKVGIETQHRTIYRVHQRVAKTYRDRRIFLAGDAAHLNNPLGGLGLNSGVHDVHNLCQKLIKVLKGHGPETILDDYESERRAVMLGFVQAQTIKNKKDMESRDVASQELRDEEMQAIANDPVRRRDFLLTQAMFKSVQEMETVQ